MTYDPIQCQGQCHEGIKVLKIADFRVSLLHQYACNQKTNNATVNYDTQKQYLNFFETDF